MTRTIVWPARCQRAERPWAGPSRSVAASAGASLLALAIAAAIALSGPTTARAEAPPAQPPPAATSPPPVQEPSLSELKPTRPGEMKSGGLLVRRADGALVEAPRVGTDYDVTVSGPTARTRVTQMFHNPASTHVEAVYVFPLPEGAAVDSLKMVIGERIVVGSIKERAEAKATYEKAKAEGKKAALVEQERPNIFTNSVANVGPGETVVVQLEYQEPVRRTGAEYALRLPLVVAPRYNPKPLVQTVDLGGDGWGRAVNDPVPDRARIEPPYLDPRESAPTNPVTIKVRLAAGFPLGEVKSRYHAIKMVETDEASRVVTLDAGAIPADRDFELNWRAASSKTPAVGLFRETVAGSEYVLAFVTPPSAPSAGTEHRPREMILVIDNSGSMGGTSIGQAKASLAFALQRLKAGDRFNVIRFNHTLTALFPNPVTANQASVAQALAFVGSLQATGGTEMLPALDAALADSNPGDADHLRQVVFLTDGAIGNEHQLLDTIAARRGRSRIFTVGIGSAPNSYLMTRAAELGRGTFTHIGAVSEVEERMRALFEKLEAPVVTGLSASFGDNQADATPGLLPDLHKGEPLVLAAKLSRPGGTLEIKGTIGDRPWVVTLPLDRAAEGKGLSKVWARRKIADAEVAKTLRNITPAEADKTILALALEHHLVSRLTSLVAVDQEVSRAPGQPLARADIPLNLPAGWDFDKVFGPRNRQPRDIRADRAPGRQQDARVDGLLQPTATRLAAATPAHPAPRLIAQGASQGVPLPATATDAELRMLAGLALLLLSITLVVSSRRTARR
ncbi:MAG: marine proteobacterial sortase target protein [Hyphomicrobiaceae bacterium]